MKRRILLIEDESDIREIASLSLESVGGWEAIQAQGGQEGIATAARENPDAILLDVMMPDLDGPTTLQQLLSDERTAHIPVIFMTAKVQASELRKLSVLGARGVIAKPFDPIQLPTEIARMLGWGEESA